MATFWNPTGIDQQIAKAENAVARKARSRKDPYSSAQLLPVTFEGPGRVGGDPGDVHVAAVVLDHHENVEAA